MLPIQPGTDLPCRERGVGWDGPWLDEKICKAQRHPWEVESRSLQSDCSRLVDTAADTPELDMQGETAPRGRSYESNAVMVGTRDISVKLLQCVSGHFRRCLEPAAAMKLARTRSSESERISQVELRPSGPCLVWDCRGSTVATAKVFGQIPPAIDLPAIWVAFCGLQLRRGQIRNSEPTSAAIASPELTVRIWPGYTSITHPIIPRMRRF